nr:helix-turn-helix domain-containing protein [Brachybacterium equifaecis]
MTTTTTRERLLNAGVEVYGNSGARAATVRAIEDHADLPHGTLRHHFGNQEGFLAALTQHLLLLDSPTGDEAPAQMVVRWLDEGRIATRARYELTLLGIRDERVGAMLREGRDTFVAALVSRGVAPARARLAVAALDGVVLDGLLRRDLGADPAPLLALLEHDEAPRSSDRGASHRLRHQGLEPRTR